MSEELKAATELLNAYADEFGSATIGESIELTSKMQRRASDAIRVVLAALAKREAVAEQHYEADATSAREFRLIALDSGEWVMSWGLIEGTILTRTDIKISEKGLRSTIEKLFEFVAASQQAAKPRNQCDGCNAGMTLDSGGMHRNSRHFPVMACQAHKYEQAAKGEGT